MHPRLWARALLEGRWEAAFTLREERGAETQEIAPGPGTVCAVGTWSVIRSVDGGSCQMDN